MLDLLIRGGTLVDGTGRPAVRADVGVRDGRVAAIGELGELPAARTLDATGLVVAPGFVDIHGHSDFTILGDPRACSAIVQGVTTEVLGNCGHGCIPVRDPAHVRANVYGAHPSVVVDWRSWEEYLDRMAAARPAINVAPLVAHGAVRLAVVGWDERPAKPDEIAAMARLTDDLISAGAFGLSTGLEYVPGQSADEAELEALCRVAGRRGGIHASHVRDREDKAVEAIDEVIRIADRAEVPLQISHLIPRHGARHGGTVEKALGLVDAARGRRQDVTFDAHTRTFGLVNLAVALPPWALEGGPDRVRERLADRGQRAEMAKHQSIIAWFGRYGGWDTIFLLQGGARPNWLGRSLQSIGDEIGVSPFEALCEVIRTDPTDPMAPLVYSPVHSDHERELAFRHPVCMPGSDATALATDGPLATQIFPGAFTWASWFYRWSVREARLYSQEQAIHRLTEMPARRMGLRDRGVIRVGAWADVAVFDPATFAERGTLERPNQYATGMVHVLVNGRPALVDGAFADERSGKVVLKQS
ncbi:MAG: D-aminoacylase [Chloroflexi bacterium]|nr:D-aminoacylase [Chloroflexota bacterium]